MSLTMLFLLAPDGQEGVDVAISALLDLTGQTPIGGDWSSPRINAQTKQGPYEARKSILLEVFLAHLPWQTVARSWLQKPRHTAGNSLHPS